MNLQIALACALAVGLLSSASAQTVYRCGPDGRVYQQTACADGKAVEANDPRSAEQRQAAEALARNEARSAAKFDRDMAAASAAKGGKVKSGSAAASQDKAASDAKAAEKKAARQEAKAAKPQLYLSQPSKPKPPASAP